MKKGFLLIVYMLFLAIAVFPAQADVTQAQKILTKDGTEAFLELVNPHYSGNYYLQEGQADLRIWCPDGPAFAQEDEGSINGQTYYKVKMQETQGVGFTLKGITVYAITQWDNYPSKEITMDILRDGPIHIDPYGSFSYNAGCPADGNLRYEVIVANGTDDNGHDLEFYGVVERLNAIPGTSVAADEAHDTDNLRYLADYEEKVADGVWWVPVRSLGDSRYTNYEIAGMVEKTPEEKQEACSTLYEALQLFQIGNFYTGEDNIRIKEKKIDWEHHKPGYDAVRTNTGCCATDSNWLNYILRGDYEQVGFLAYSQKDGSGHILNYLYHDGFYYFIDLTHYRTDFLDSSAPETGNMSDYRNSDIVAGNFHKASSPEAYIQYCISCFNEPPARFFIYQAEDCYPLTGMEIDGRMTIIYPQDVEITPLEGKDAHLLDVAYYPAPKKKASWKNVPNAKYQVAEKYLTETTAVPTEPLTAYQAGDILSLEEYGQQGLFAVIGGQEYSLSNFQQRTQFGFEANVYMYGGNNLCYFDYEFPVHEHAEKIRDMDSLILGELMLSFNKKYSETQLMICTRENDTLKVQEVKNNPGHEMIRLCIHKDESGNWQDSPEYWCLFHYKDEEGKIQYEFGRVGCRITR